VVREYLATDWQWTNLVVYLLGDRRWGQSAFSPYVHTGAGSGSQEREKGDG